MCDCDPPQKLGHMRLDSGGFVTAFTLAATAACVATFAQAARRPMSPPVRHMSACPKDRLILSRFSFYAMQRTLPINRFVTQRAQARRHYRLKLTCAALLQRDRPSVTVDGQITGKST